MAEMAAKTAAVFEGNVISRYVSEPRQNTVHLCNRNDGMIE